MAVWKRIIQLPLTLGGLSLRLPESIGDIAYASSCMDSLPMMRAAALKMKVQCAVYLVPDLSTTLGRIQEIMPELDATYWKQAEDPLTERREPLQHTITSFLNCAEIHLISETLSPWPLYHLAFRARVHAQQAHVSWALNPRTRGHYAIGALSNSEFARTIAIATLYPIISPRVCECGKPIDPAAFHLLHCRFNSYVFIHEQVKEAVARFLRSLSVPEIAPLIVQVEQPMRLLCPLRDASAPEGSELVADLVVSMHNDLQQEPLICDFTSCLARISCSAHSFNGALRDAARLKVAKYRKYLTSDGSFYPLPFGRTNVLSAEIFDFCSVVGSRYPNHYRVKQKLIAVFSRSIYAGVAHSHSLAIRRLQLSVSARVPLNSVRPLSLLSPHVSQPRDRPLPRIPSMSALTEPLMHARLSAVLAGSSSDSAELREFIEDVRGGL